MLAMRRTVSIKQACSCQGGVRIWNSNRDHDHRAAARPIAASRSGSSSSHRSRGPSASADSASGLTPFKPGWNASPLPPEARAMTWRIRYLCP